MTNIITATTTNKQIGGMYTWVLTSLTVMIACFLLLTMTSQTALAQGTPCELDCLGVQPEEILEAGDGDLLPEFIFTKKVFLPVVFAVETAVASAHIEGVNGSENPCTNDCAQVELEAGDGDLLPEFTSPVRVFLPAIFGK